MNWKNHPAFLVLALLVSTVPASAQVAQHAVTTPVKKPFGHLFAVTTSGPAAGTILDVRGGPPWNVATVGTTAGGTLLRRFGPDLFVVHTFGDVVERQPVAGGASQLYDLGPDSMPQDVLVATSGTAWVTRRNDPFLARIDLATGVVSDVLDLSFLGDGMPIALGTLERDGTRLFVQVKVFGAVPVGGDFGLLAVVDLVTETLIDVDPIQAGVQGIALGGAPPRLKMQIVEPTRTLFVSATEGTFDGAGAIEMVDLDALTSIGFALTEKQTAELSGFVMTSPGAGWFVFHTDFAASTHLKPFTIAGGPAPGPEVLVLLGDQVSSLAYDAREQQLYLPSGFAGAPGVWVVDTLTQELVGNGPIPTGAPPRDVILAR